MLFETPWPPWPFHLVGLFVNLNLDYVFLWNNKNKVYFLSLKNIRLDFFFNLNVFLWSSNIYKLVKKAIL